MDVRVEEDIGRVPEIVHLLFSGLGHMSGRNDSSQKSDCLHNQAVNSQKVIDNDLVLFGRCHREYRSKVFFSVCMNTSFL